jgi:predicted permease
MSLRDLFLRVRALTAPRRVERELDEELAFHIERETQKFIAEGLEPADAGIRARARFGSVPLAADRCRDVRGTALVGAVARDVRDALRSVRRAPLAALTIVATVALGLGLMTVAFTVYNAFFLRVDGVRSPGELFAVHRPVRPGAGAWRLFTRPEYEALRRETSVFADVVAMLRGVSTRVDGRLLTSTLVSGNFFEVLGVDAALGRTLTEADDERLAGRPVMVLSHRGWRRLFASDPAVIGRRVLVNGMSFAIVGVMPEHVRGLSVVAPDYWAPLALAGRFRHGYAGREGEITLDDVVGRLKPGISPAAATAGLAVWVTGQTDRQGPGGRPLHVRLTPSQGTLSAGVLQGLRAFAPIFFAFGLVLMVGCANVANLLLARGVARQRELGIRLSLGASRRRIVRQLLTESLLLALVSAACAFAVSRLLLDGALYAAMAAMPPEIAEPLTSLGPPPADWRVLAFLVAGAVVSTAFFGLAPALYATRIELVRTMRGELTRDARPGRTRHALIALQVGASALLLISAAVFLRSALAASTAGPGLRTSDTVMVPVTTESRRAALLQEVAAHPSVASVAASAPAVDGLLGSQTTTVEALTERRDEAPSRTVVGYQFVSPEYFDVLGIDVLKGRGFTPAERTAGAGVVVVSERTARRLWPDRDAVGRVVRFRADQPPHPAQPATEGRPSSTYAVVGVVRDVGPGSLLFAFNSPGLYLPTGPESAGTSLTLRVHGDPDDARRALLERLPGVDPALGQIRTVRTMAGMQAYVLLVAFWVTVVLGGLALALTLSGLFGVLSYVVEQRTHEIGVRMALGATRRNVARLVLSQSFAPVGVGIAAGGGLAAALATYLMSTPAASQIGSVVHVFDPMPYVVSLLVVLTACVLAALVPALRAARFDPIATLRKD